MSGHAYNIDELYSPEDAARLLRSIYAESSSPSDCITFYFSAGHTNNESATIRVADAANFIARHFQVQDPRSSDPMDILTQQEMFREITQVLRNQGVDRQIDQRIELDEFRAPQVNIQCVTTDNKYIS